MYGQHKCVCTIFPNGWNAILTFPLLKRSACMQVCLCNKKPSRACNAAFSSVRRSGELPTYRLQCSRQCTVLAVAPCFHDGNSRGHSFTTRKHFPHPLISSHVSYFTRRLGEKFAHKQKVTILFLRITPFSCPGAIHTVNKREVGTRVVGKDIN